MRNLFQFGYFLAANVLLRMIEAATALIDLVLRFLIGGLVVSLFSLIGDLLKPKSFAGLFGAAPSVALGTLALTAGSKGTSYAAVESRSMLLGAVSLGIYAYIVCRLLMVKRMPPRAASIGGILVWFLAASGLFLACFG